jgi:putative flippase GtrA
MLFKIFSLLFHQVWRHRFLRFLIVGGINTMLTYGLYAGSLFIGLHYAWAVLVSTAVGFLVKFKTTGVLVFRNRDNSLLWRFLMVGLLIYVLNVLLLRALKNAGIVEYLAGAILILPMSAVNYFLNRNLVFERSGPFRRAKFKRGYIQANRQRIRS